MSFEYKPKGKESVAGTATMHYVVIHSFKTAWVHALDAVQLRDSQLVPGKVANL